MSVQDNYDGDVTLTNVVESVGAYAVYYVDLSTPGRYFIAYGEKRDDIDRPFWQPSHRKQRNADGDLPDSIFGGQKSDAFREVMEDHFQPGDDGVYKIPWDSDTVLGVCLWDDTLDEYMVVKLGDHVTVDIEDAFGASNNHKTTVERLRGHRGDRATIVTVKSEETGKKAKINPDQIRSLRDDGPAWDRGDDSQELEPQK